MEPPLWQRLVAPLMYLLPWSDAIPLGFGPDGLFLQYPVLRPLVLPVLPLMQLERSIPFGLGGLLLFFVLFLAVAERCEEILEETGVTDKVQLATFHPEYHFAGEEVGDPGSYTNRSPYPTVHLLRSVDVSRAVDAHPDTESIPEANIERLRAVGRKTLLEGLRELAAWRSG